MVDIKKRAVIKGTVKLKAHGTVKIADIGLKTATHKLAGKSDAAKLVRDAASVTKRKAAARRPLKVLGKGVVKVADLGLKTANRTMETVYKGVGIGRAAFDSSDEKSTTDYAERNIRQLAARQASRTNRTGARTALRTAKNIRRGTLDPAQTIKRGSSGLKTAAAEAKNAKTALTAARRSPQAAAMIRQAQKRSRQASKELVKAAVRTVRAVAKAVGDMFALVFGGVWLVAALLLVIVIGAAVLTLNTPDPENTNIRYSESGTAAYYFLRSKMGLNSAAACGLMANIDAESGFNVHALGDNGTSFGLCQWHEARWDGLKGFCAGRGYSSESLQGQLYYLEWELEHYFPGVLDFLLNVDDDMFGCYEAAAYFCIHFENPAEAEKRGDERGLIATQKFWPNYAMMMDSEKGMDLVVTAYFELGYTGGERYWRWYGFDHREEWCACFVSWCANECGYIDDGIIPKYAGCDYGVSWFQNKGQWLSRSIEPSPGMIVFFDWAGDGSSQDGSADHTGIVFKVTNDTVYVIEGNSLDCCRINQYPVGHYEILGYGVPRF